MAKVYKKNIKKSSETGNERGKKLSPREKEVYELMISGQTNVTICKILCICRGTLEKYITKIYRKKEVKNRIELINKHYGKG